MIIVLFKITGKTVEPLSIEENPFLKERSKNENWFFQRLIRKRYITKKIRGFIFVRKKIEGTSCAEKF